ncbi:MAG: hypothetical protein ABR955_07255 [Verrucomicrobiota bacterium]|jgi:hypothetical protein
MRLTPKLAWALGSLAPVAACVLLVFSILNPGNSGVFSHNEPMVALILSNRSDPAYLPGDFQGAQNNVSSVTFDWTNHGGLTSSMSPFQRGRTNY